MKRSSVNSAIEQAIAFYREQNLLLPEFAFWSPEDWRGIGYEADEIRDCRLGWDVADFGREDFARIGRTLFTLRNGRHNDARYTKKYAEKFIFNPEGQAAPFHFHRSKMEDINDNFFIEEMKRFPPIEEDVPARYLLCGEYPRV